MSATVAQIGKGTSFGYSATVGGSPTFTTVAEVTKITMPKHSAKPVEIMRYDSPTNYPEQIAGWCDSSEVEIDITYQKTVAAALFALLNVPATYLITKPDASTWTYVAIMTEFGDELPLKESMTNTLKFKISGAPTPSTTSA
jgi:hypothetical protein